MVAFGLILLLIGVGAGGWLAWLALQSETGVTLGATGLQLTVLPITLFVAGAASMLLCGSGCDSWPSGPNVGSPGARNSRSCAQRPRPPVARVREALTVSRSRRAQPGPARAEARAVLGHGPPEVAVTETSTGPSPGTAHATSCAWLSAANREA